MTDQSHAAPIHERPGDDEPEMQRAWDLLHERGFVRSPVDEDPGEDITEPSEPLDPETVEKLREQGIEFPDWTPTIPERSAASRRVAALFVDPAGVYSGLPGVDVWDEARDARLYAGPWPVVAHPPCARWSNLAHIHKHRWPIGADDGCFAAALHAVRTYGGVLEHPCGSLAWREHGLPYATRWGWSRSFDDPGLVTEIDQGGYGHRARKRTWLYAVNVTPEPLDWRPSRGRYPVEDMSTAGGEAARTPPAFRDVLLAMARSVSREECAA